ncbi:dTMP kinase [Parasphingopyxis sp.]|uniref:dTMP kinase n=1 Tax=Parasphingopyxis sp. TaxID=1920299 RepID=UPI00262B93C2|nr:dTMP kinase [Parasphingopyxis sp.]
MPGKFITLEGGEGAGKSTQAKLLASWLHEQGIETVETREPGGTPGADAVRALLLENDTPLTPMAEAHLFAAARADHVETLIRPALADGKWVICDRFIDSTLAYQGAAGELGVDIVRAINETAIGDTWPDLTVLLRMNGDAGTQRAIARDGAESDRFTSRDFAFHASVAEAFDVFASNEPDRFAIIDGGQTVDQVAEAVRAAVRERLI